MTVERKYAIVTDSTADLPEDIAKKHQIDVIPAIVNFGDESYRDGIDIGIEEFLEKIKDKNNPHPTTAAPSLGEYLEVYKKHDGESITIHVGKQFSGIFPTAEAASKEMPPGKVHPYDSETVSLGLGFMVIQASILSQEGYNKEEILEKLDDMKKRTTVYALLDTAEYLERGGRATTAQAMLVGVLKIKPMLEISRNSITGLEKIRTRKTAHNKLIQLVQDFGPLEKVGVMQAGAETYAEEIANRISEFYSGEIMHADITPVVAVHGGPGTLGVALLKEKK